MLYTLPKGALTLQINLFKSVQTRPDGRRSAAMILIFIKRPPPPNLVPRAQNPGLGNAVSPDLQPQGTEPRGSTCAVCLSTIRQLLLHLRMLSMQISRVTHLNCQQR